MAAGLLVLGVGYALILGAEQRREVIDQRLRITVHNARQLKPADFAAFTTPEFQPTDIQVAADGTGTARAPGFAPVMEAAARALADRVRATQFQKAAGFLVLHDGWLVEAAGTAPRPHPDSVFLRGRATADDVAAWREKRLFVRYSPVPEQGAPYYCRAPLLGPDGRMLGWLESPREEFYASLARKWRTSPLLITALGVVLTVALYFQKRATLEREHAARTAAVAAEANRLKTAFLAKVSHELRTPIQSLLGYGELLQARLGDDAQARAWLGALQQHGEIMTRLINDLLDLSAAESGSFRLLPQPLEPAALVRRVVASLEPRATAKGLQLSCTTTPAVPAWVEADGNRLAQVALNLVGNALKFTTAGAVTVTLDAVPEPADPAHMRLVLTVRDTGPGITPEEQVRLFEPFSRLERTAAHEGSGLGLALSAVLCRAMHGCLTVESDGLTGSSFRAELVVPVAPEPTAVSVPRPAGSPPACVLVVDDNLLLRELFASYLRSRGCTCQTAASGAEAMAHAQTGTPDAVVLDVSLPDADGIELAPRLRALLPRARLVGVSAHGKRACMISTPNPSRWKRCGVRCARDPPHRLRRRATRCRRTYMRFSGASSPASAPSSPPPWPGTTCPARPAAPTTCAAARSWCRRTSCSPPARNWKRRPLRPGPFPQRPPGNAVTSSSPASCRRPPEPRDPCPSQPRAADIYAHATESSPG